jgi:hypothetical protein
LPPFFSAVFFSEHGIDGMVAFHAGSSIPFRAMRRFVRRPLTEGFYQASDGQDRTNIVDLKFIQSNPDSETFFQSGKQIDERHGIQDSRCQQVRPRA